MSKSKGTKEDAPYRFPKGELPESTWERFAGEYLDAIQNRLEAV